MWGEELFIVIDVEKRTLEKKFDRTGVFDKKLWHDIVFLSR